MACTVFGPGLVGSYLGIAAGAWACIPGASQRPLATTAIFPAGPQSWQPQIVDSQHVRGPLLVSTRWNDTPWSELPDDALAAQNGLGQPRAVAVCFLALDLNREGSVVHLGPTPRIVARAPTSEWLPIFANWRAAGMMVEEVDDVQPAQWEKTILNATVGPLCLATGLSMADLWSHPQWQTLILDATREGIRIAQAEGVAIDPALEQRAIDFFSASGAHRPSILKHPGELSVILSPLLRSAQRHQLAAPALQYIAAAVEPSNALAAKG